MDEARFDHWVRDLGRSTSRRRVGSAFLGGVAALAPAALTLGKKKKRKKKKGRNGSTQGKLCAERCPAGCCTAEQGNCRPGTVAAQCGDGGEICRACADGELCHDRQCCRGTLTECETDQECCGSWVCKSLGQPSKLCCALNGDGPDPANPSCCDPGDVHDGVRCCRTVGGSCQEGTRCCGEAICSPTSKTCCLMTNTECAFPFECCSNRCTSGKCV